MYPQVHLNQFVWDIEQVIMTTTHTEDIQDEPKSPNNKRRATRETLTSSVKGSTQKSTLVIVNPKSGIQKARQIFEKVWNLIEKIRGTLVQFRTYTYDNEKVCLSNIIDMPQYVWNIEIMPE